MIERIILAKDMFLDRVKTSSGYSYRILQKESVQIDPHPKTGWGVTLFEQFSKIKPVTKIEGVVDVKMVKAK